jgi:hypothetical protein
MSLDSDLDLFRCQITSANHNFYPVYLSVTIFILNASGLLTQLFSAYKKDKRQTNSWLFVVIIMFLLCWIFWQGYSLFVKYMEQTLSLEFNRKLVTKSPTSIEAEISLQNLQQSLIKHYNQPVLFRVLAIIASKYGPVLVTLSRFVSCRDVTVLVLFILSSGHPVY